jgi:Iron-containing redox enzyme
LACLPVLEATPISGKTHVKTTRLAPPVALIQDKTTAIIDELIDSLPDPRRLTSEECRGIIARYTSVLEGNFIYWMTATVIAAKAEQSRPILLGNLYEEVHDCHPLMLRKFAMAANAFPTDKDAMAVHDDLTKVRQFMGKLSPVKSVLTMGFFEGFIQKFMSYLADLAAEQGSTEREYTDVHGVCDIEHTEGLFKVLAAEIALTPPEPDADLFEGVTLLRTLIEQIIRPNRDRLQPKAPGGETRVLTKARPEIHGGSRNLDPQFS